MRQAYHIRLNDLTDHGARMCQLAGDTLGRATRAMLTVDLNMAEQVIALDTQVDGMRFNAEALALELLALQAPVASDLRRVITALWIVADAQRMSTLAIHVAKATRRRHPGHVIPETVRPVYERMGEVGVRLAAQASQALRDQDAGFAARMEAEDDLMDDLHQEMFAAVLASSWCHGVGSAVDLSLLGRFYERFGDHAVAIAQRVVFLATGETTAATQQ